MIELFLLIAFVLAIFYTGFRFAAGAARMVVTVLVLMLVALAVAIFLVLMVSGALAAQEFVTISNSNFTFDLDGWTTTGEVEWTSYGYSGGGASISSNGTISQAVSIATSDTYTLSAYVNCKSQQVDVYINQTSTRCGTGDWGECTVSESLPPGSADIWFTGPGECVIDSITMFHDIDPTPTPTPTSTPTLTPTITPTPTTPPTPTPTPFVVVLPTPAYQVVTYTLPTSGNVAQFELRATAGDVILSSVLLFLALVVLIFVSPFPRKK